MKVFVTGASGFIGSAVTQELIRAGHEVTGLARSEASAKVILATGAKVLRGSLEDIESLRKGAAQSDGVIHTGFIHDFTKFKENCEIDRRAIEVMGAELAGSNRPLVVTSGLAGLTQNGEVATEEHDVNIQADKYPRVSESAALELVKRKVNASVVRLAVAVHGDSEQGFRAGFASVLIGVAQQKGVSAYIGDGLNLWPGFHRLDAGKLYRLALEKKVAGAKYHGVEGKGVSTKKLAEVIGKKLNVPVVSLSPEEGAKHFTWLTSFVMADIAASNKITQERLGWKPTQIELVADIERATLPADSRYTV
jgi:nucleoside-diphosphate-sugar epimerase